MRYFFVTALWLGACGMSYAQQNDIAQQLDKIKAPTSPAAIIINNQAATISRPKSWSALEAAIFSNYLNEEGLTIPNNFSLEFSPYWAGDSSKVSVQEFLMPTLKESLAQNFSISLSSTQNFILNDSVNSNAIGFGVRTMLWSGTKKEKKTVLQSIMKMMTRLRQDNLIFSLADRIIEDGQITMTNDSIRNRTDFIALLVSKIGEEKGLLEGLTSDQKKTYLESLKAKLTAGLPPLTSTNQDTYSDNVDKLEISEVDVVFKDLSEYATDRKGFKLEIAAAMALDFPTNETDFSVVPTLGVWLTPSFQPYKSDWIEFLGVLRYQRFNLEFYETFLGDNDQFENTFDYGARLVIMKKKFTMEFEGVGRVANTVISRETNDQGTTTKSTKTDTDFQYLLNFNYRIKDNLGISFNFGKRFDPVIDINGTLISLLSLNFGLDPATKNDLK